MDCSPPCSSVLGILQARILEAVAISSSQRIFPTQGSNPRPLCLLHWQADSLPLHHLGSLLMPRDPQILISSCVSRSVHARAHTHTHTHTIPLAQENSHSLSPPQHSPLTPQSHSRKQAWGHKDTQPLRPAPRAAA